MTPSEREEIEKVRDNFYTVVCLLCGSVSNLQMFPQRINGQMVGWIFICDQHEDHEIPETVRF